ncbi:hypothetical protein C4B63_25g214 [Trypanosoma cruzi]|uniref:Uncharacterized protein n=1 Tax=Trypanosoma cruzi TaxID=5693 RepID=A0A2V2VJZ6_TRYCR|nr:hypothetical protein C4B63_25g214 [Trypanosoma cruzi]
MRVSLFCRYDSFKSMHGNITSLFALLKSPESVQREVRQYVCHVPRRYMDSPRQRGSWVRGTLNLIFEEARRRGSYAVARAAVEVTLEQQQQQKQQQQQQLTMESTWVKNALAACRTPEELREMETLLTQHRCLLGGMGEAGCGLTPQRRAMMSYCPHRCKMEIMAGVRCVAPLLLLPLATVRRPWQLCARGGITL